MKLISKYSPPTPHDLNRVKSELGFTGEQMAEICGLGGSNQWRKYTGGNAPRTMSAATAFLLAAQLVLSEDEIIRVAEKMKDMGASVEVTTAGFPPKS